MRQGYILALQRSFDTLGQLNSFSGRSAKIHILFPGGFFSPCFVLGPSASAVRLHRSRERPMSLKYQGKFLFGEFQVDLSQRVCLRLGQTVALGPKTFDVLAYLVQNAQRVVSKDELLLAVWPNSNVEESNLSQHVFLLRKALSSGQLGGKVIVTVPGRGYQFTQPVKELPPQGFNTAQNLIFRSVESVTRVVVEEERGKDLSSLRQQIARPVIEAVPAAAKALPVPVETRKTDFYWAVLAALAVLVGLAGFLGWRALHPNPTARVDAVLVELDNRTGDADFDGALQQALQIDIEQSRVVNLLSGDKIRETLAQMQQPGTTHLTPALAREVCERNNAQVILSSTLSRLGSEFVLLLTAESCASGQQLAGARVVATSKEKVLPALDSAASQLRRKLGDSAGTPGVF